MTKKNNKQQMLELLAPAKDFNSGKATILAGADAVYIGGPNFGARQAAWNSWQDIEKLVKFAHRYYVKIYIALNTIFFDTEREAVKESIKKAFDIGVDAVITQDMGILEMDLPPIPLIASTQCHNYEPEYIKFLEEAGFSRVILARELSLKQIKEIRSKTEIDLEFFVHGALCVSFSGRCYLSQAICGKSANRGQCMQACRLPFSLADADEKELVNNKFLLSLKDLNLSASLKDLLSAGITSFKIEGRLKDEFYGANVTAKYSQELNKIIEESGGKYKRASSGKVKLKFEPDLEKTFNRGYTEYFLNGRQKEIISLDSQKSLGKFIGKVKYLQAELNEDYFMLDRESDLKNGDGICWFNDKDVLVGTNINIVRGWKIYPNKFIPRKAGIDIYRNSDLSFENKIANGVERNVSVDFAIKETEKGFSIAVKDEDENIAEMEFEFEKKSAKKPEVVEINWKNQLSKLGETVFFPVEFSYDLENSYFIPLSILNEWRKNIIKKLSEIRTKNYPKISVEHKKTSHLYHEKKLDYTYNVSNSLSKIFHERHGAEVIDDAFEMQKITKDRIVMTTKHCLKYFLGACHKESSCVHYKYKEPLYLINSGKKYRISFDCKNCRMEVWNIL
jgi:collagenase-like PrtC family protease